MRYFFLFLLYIPLGLQASEDSLKMEAHFIQAQTLYASGGNPDSIMAHFESAAQIASQLENWQAYVLTYLSRFLVANDARDLDKLRFFAYESVEKAKEHLPEDHVFQFYARSNLGVYLSTLGDYRQALDISKQELQAISQRSSSPQKLKDLVDVRLLMGTYWDELGDHNRAIESYHESIRILTDSLQQGPEYKSSMGWAKWKTAASFYQLKNYKQAIKELKEGIEFLHREDKGNLKQMIKMHQSLANNYCDQGFPKKALEILARTKVLQDTYTSKGGNMMEGEMYYWVLGKAQQALGNIAASHEAHLQSVKVVTNAFKEYKRDPRMGFFIKKLGDHYLYKDDWIPAIQTYNRALLNYLVDQDSLKLFETPAFSKILVPRKHIVNLLFDRNKGYLALYNKEKQVRYLQEAWNSSLLALNLIDNIRQNLNSQGSQLFISSQVLPSYEQALEISLSLYELLQDDAYLIHAFNISEKAKSVLLYAAMKESKALLTLSTADSLLRHTEYLQREIGFYQTQWFEEQGQQQDSKNSIGSIWKSKIFSLQEELTQTLETIKLRNPSYFAFAFSPNIDSLERLRNMLHEQEGLLEYFWGDSSLYVFYLDKQHLEARTIKRNSKFDQDLQTLLSQLNGKIPEDYPSFVHTARALYQQLVGPELDKYNPGRLRIIPDGPLGHLSFEILLAQDPAQQNTYRSLPYLGKEIPLSYAYSTHLMQMEVQASRSKESRSWLGFAPTFVDEVQLSFSAEELKDIHQHTGGQFYTGADANLETFKHLAPSFKTLHLSTHGYANEDNPAFAYLVFASDDKSKDLPLYAHEIAQLPLQADLVVLSACESGYGNWAKGEGIMSLARSFRLAGCNSILSSLWKSEGDVSKAIMQGFYSHYSQDMPKDESLQLAKFEFLDNCMPNQIHPRHWANFVLMGADLSPTLKWTWKYWLLMGLCLVAALLGLGYLAKQKSLSNTLTDHSQLT